ncbi:MAG: malonyl-CoA synthase [Rhodobacteraceae bacterium]|nr:MAG: malonyl-CoA synthase [Paracoccaceae bacterium]
MHGQNHLIGKLSAAAARAPEAPCVVRVGTGETLTRGAFWAGAERMAGAFAAAGVTPGDRVALQTEKSVEALQAIYGALMAGAAVLPLNPGFTDEETGYFLGDAEPAVFVCDPRRAEALGRIAAEEGVGLTMTLAADGTGALATAAAGAAFPGAAIRRADDLAALLYTSGTTGRSKGAMLTHGNLAVNAEALVEIWAIAEADALLHALPIFHTHGLFVATNTALLAGATMRLHAKFDAAAALADLPHATLMMGVPTFYTRLLDQPGLHAAAAGMRLFISGSAPLRAEDHEAWTAATGHAILERYGMTETGMLTSNPYEGARRAGTVGHPLPGVELLVADPSTGEALPDGETGSIEVRGPNVFRGYWRMPEKSAEAFRPSGFFVTGDLGRIDPDGYLSIVGRAKDLIISGGFNVYPKEVESVIDSVEGVAESAVIGVPHPDFGEAVTAVVVRLPGAAVDAAAILAETAARLARYKQPKAVFFADALPRNAMGKVQKNVLAKTHARAFARDA